MNALVNDLIFLQVVQAAFVFANALILLIAVKKKNDFPLDFAFFVTTQLKLLFTCSQYEVTVAEFNVAMFWLSAFLAEMAIYCYFGNNIIYTVHFFLHRIALQITLQISTCPIYKSK